MVADYLGKFSLIVRNYSFQNNSFLWGDLRFFFFERLHFSRKKDVIYWYSRVDTEKILFRRKKILENKNLDKNETLYSSVEGGRFVGYWIKKVEVEGDKETIIEESDEESDK